MTIHACAPDVELSLPGGKSISPAEFRGQKLAIFYSPEADSASRREAEEYSSLAEQFEQAGTWVLGVTGGGRLPELADDHHPHVRMALDPDGSALAALRLCLEPGHREARRGATFLFARDGTLTHNWSSGGHARDALRAACEHP